MKSQNKNKYKKVQSNRIAGHVDKVLITTTLGSRGLEKKIVVYISPEVISWNQLLSKIKKMVADIIFSEHGRLLGNCEREKLHRSCQPKHQPGNNQHHHQVKIVKIASTGDHYHGGRSKGRKPQPSECHRQLGERGEHGLAKPTSGKVIFLWFLDCESNMKSKHPLSTAFASHHLFSGKAWICPAGSQAQNLTVLSGSSND